MKTLEQVRKGLAAQPVRSEGMVLRRIGADAFARTMNVSSDQLLLTTAAILGGMAGPNSSFPNRWDAAPLPRTNLLIGSDDKNGARLLECLTAPATRLQKRLVQNMTRYRPEAVDVLLRGYDPSAAKKGTPKGHADKTLLHVQEALTRKGGYDCLGSLHEDLVFDHVIQRGEAMKYPRMLLSNMPWGEVPDLVAECHLKHALVITPTLAEYDIQKLAAKDERKANQIRSLLDGSLCYHSENGRGLDPRLNAWLILGLNRDERARVAGGDLAERFIWSSGGRHATPNAAETDPSLFFEIYHSSIEKVVELRRLGESPMIGFESPESAREFSLLQDEYQAAVPGGRVGKFDPTLSLPQTLLWTLQFLRESLERPGSLSDADLMATAFGCAGRLRDTHRTLLLDARGQGLVEERLLLAREITRRLERWIEEGHEAPTTREISRWFNRQKKERFVPVLDALAGAGVITLGKGKRFVMGKVELDTVEEDLTKIFSGS